MADRLLLLSADGSRRATRASLKRARATPLSPGASCASGMSTASDVVQDVKAAAMGKLQRTDTDDTGLGTHEDSSACTQFGASGLCHAQPQPAITQSHSGEVVDGPSSKYIRGTRLIVGGWFQACRGCNEPTAHCAPIGGRDVPLCPRCKGKYRQMVEGALPPSSCAPPTPGVEPLHLWLPRLLPATPLLSAQQRRDFCDALVLRQDDAWLQLIQTS